MCPPLPPHITRSLIVYRCQRCHFCTYETNGIGHAWFYTTAVGTMADHVVETLCPICGTEDVPTEDLPGTDAPFVIEER